ncbi:carboxylesterase family protein [Paenibacillus sp. JCM 10914]|uniref:carboxylesterase family protein n=1 Tax=Paenibacillus sp. JCM 10914 TaxID=1236974 RepID=UPI0003CC63DA|nr:carboxylesterase family protein [Paenibacillus sp. JCM 10914]GAE08055.1 putative carboxylesterase [Paenibacillus sp. JCM 10914]
MNTKEKRDETITIASGQLKGIRQTEIDAIAWLGIPYALPPVDKLRWKAPREVKPWTGILPVREFSNSSFQMIQGVPSGSEDCLYVNIWRPDHTDSGLPVFVFLHGGGNTNGSGSDFQGGQLACETNSIVITVNYRLGAMGFFRHPALRTGDPLDDSGNYGLLDIIHALKWVQTNIVAFGGNPENVTLAGHSAGARNALAAYLSPLSEGLFHKLCAMSGGLTTATPEQGEAKANDILASLLMETGLANNIEEAIDWISTQSAAAISDYLMGQKAILFAATIGETGLRMAAFPHLFEDGTVIPREGFENLKHRIQPCMPIILGSTASEFSGFASMDPYLLHQVQHGQLAENAEQKKLYEAVVQYGSELYAAFNVEQVAEKLIRSIPELPIYAYRFGWGLHDALSIPPFVL